MTSEERKAVREALTAAAQEARSAQRTVEMLANLLEWIRKEVLLTLGPDYDGYAYRIFDVLVKTPNLERMPLYAPDHTKPHGDLLWPEYKQRDWYSQFHWVIMEHALPPIARFGSHAEAERAKMLLDELQKETVI